MQSIRHCPAIHTAVANDKGRGELRPGWEIVYNHYAKVKKLGSGYKYAKQAADKMRPECGVDGSDRYGTPGIQLKLDAVI